jgi:hypothetical protein
VTSFCVSSLLNGRRRRSVPMRRTIRTLKTTIKSKSPMRMLKHLLAAALFLGAFQAQAEVIIYQGRTSLKHIGDGFEGTSSSQAFFVWNLENNHVSQIVYYARGIEKLYSVSGAPPTVLVLDGSQGRQYTTFSVIGVREGREQTEFNRGQNALLATSAESTVSFPRAFKGSGHTVTTASAPRLTEYSRTLAFSEKRTKAANDAALSEEQVVESLVTELQVKGYSAPSPRVVAAASDAGAGQATGTDANPASAYDVLPHAANQPRP